MNVFNNPRCARTARVTVVTLCFCLCLSVCFHCSEGIARFYANVYNSGIGFSRILICGLSKKP